MTSCRRVKLSKTGIADSLVVFAILLFIGTQLGFHYSGWYYNSYFILPAFLVCITTLYATSINAWKAIIQNEKAGFFLLLILIFLSLLSVSQSNDVQLSFKRWLQYFSLTLGAAGLAVFARSSERRGTILLFVLQVGLLLVLVGELNEIRKNWYIYSHLSAGDRYWPVNFPHIRIMMHFPTIILLLSWGMILAEKKFIRVSGLVFQQIAILFLYWGASRVTLATIFLSLVWLYLFVSRKEILLVFTSLAISCSVAVAALLLTNQDFMTNAMSQRFEKDLDVLAKSRQQNHGYSTPAESNSALISSRQSLFDSPHTYARAVYGEISQVGSGRVGLWQIAIDCIRDDYLIGKGPEAYLLCQDGKVEREKRFAHPHNLFVQVLVETGLLGFFAILLTIWIAVYKGFQCSRKRRCSTFGLAISTCGFGLLVDSLFSGASYFPVPMLFMFLSIFMLFSKNSMEPASSYLPKQPQRFSIG